jgi:hypothetical protein
MPLVALLYVLTALLILNPQEAEYSSGDLVRSFMADLLKRIIDSVL